MKKTILLLMFFVSGCTTFQSTYTPPKERGALPKKIFKVNKSFGSVWQSLIKYSARKSFTVINAEKKSGTLTLSFGTTHPRRYIDCGELPAKKPIFTEPFLYVAKKMGTVKLLGIAKILVKSIDSDNTNITFTTHYTLEIKNKNRPKQIWDFDTNEVQSRKIGKLAITCMSMLVAEIDIIAGINSMTGGH